tara:strand:- start:13 stop:240 length:228 start_codon:yes stop_codon:yes gene_type:complete
VIKKKQNKMNSERENKETIIRIEGDIKLIHQKIDTLKDNHLWHIERDMNSLRKLIWFIGTTVFAQLMFIVVRTFM